MVPYARNPFFTAREDALASIQTAFSSGKATTLTQPAAMTGLGGIGKTQIAVEYAYRHKAEYVDVLWVSATDMATLREGFVEVARRLRLPEAQQANGDLAVQAVKDWLGRTEHWLLILDNADDLTLVSAFVPPQRGGHILLTTRASATGAVARNIPITKMSDENGALLLLRRVKSIAEEAPLDTATLEDQQAALALTREVDCLPLALDQAGAYIEETHLTPLRYLALYRDQAAELLKEYGIMERDHASVYVTYSLAFERIAKTSFSAGELVRCCALLGADAIPEEIFTDGDASLNRGQGPFGTKGLAWEQVIREACRYSLLSRAPDGKHLSIHRLVQTVIQHELNKTLPWSHRFINFLTNRTMYKIARRDYAERVVRAVDKVFPDPEVAVSGWSSCERMLPHAWVCTSYIADYALSFKEATRLLNNMGCYLRKHAQYTDAIPLSERVLSISERALGSEHLDTAASLNNLACLYQDVGDHAKALPLYARALAIRERVSGPDHQETATSLNHLADLYQSQGNFVDAEELHGRALTIREQALPQEPLSTAKSLGHLATLYQIQGRFRDAEPLLARALKIHQEVLGLDHLNTATSLNNLAGLYHSQGNFAQALPLHTRALAIRERILGPDHPETAISLNNLAGLYSTQRRYTEALPMLKRALLINEKALGPKHPHTAVIVNHLATVYQAQGKHSRAMLLYQRALSIREQALGPEHPSTGQSLKNMASFYYTQRRYEDAEPLLNRALRLYEKKFGMEHPDTISVRQSYAVLLSKLNKQ